MKDNGIAKIVGLPSSGGHSPFRSNWFAKLANGKSTKIVVTTGEGYRPNGEPLEGNPAVPDIRIDFQEGYLKKVIDVVSH
jgi:C-terminal processing protease CtpA/Prc